ncbi:hypothetical protein BGX24_000899 [Mortierella sp. AD032]|nr:hypothetical protein BGX24_000899 [Mortierella sp. AD032]
MVLLAARCDCTRRFRNGKQSLRDSNSVVQESIDLQPVDLDSGVGELDNQDSSSTASIATHNLKKRPLSILSKKMQASASEQPTSVQRFGSSVEALPFQEQLMPPKPPLKSTFHRAASPPDVNFADKRVKMSSHRAYYTSGDEWNWSLMMGTGVYLLAGEMAAATETMIKSSSLADMDKAVNMMSKLIKEQELLELKEIAIFSNPQAIIRNNWEIEISDHLHRVPPGTWSGGLSRPLHNRASQGDAQGLIKTCPD